MIGQNDVISYCGRRVYERASHMSSRLIQEFNITQDPVNHMLNIDASVESSNHYTYYDVHIVMSSDANFILHSECDCPFYESYESPCKHIALVLLEFIRRKETYRFTNGRFVLKKNTDDSLLSLMRQISSVPRASVPASPVFLTPELALADRSGGILDAEFKVSAGGCRPYVVKSISELCRTIRSHEEMRYGKALSFVHSIDAFDPSCRPLVRFLMSLDDDNDMYTSSTGNSSYYYSTYYNAAPRLGRSLTLRGRYLDLFMKTIENIPFYVNVTIRGQQTPVPYTICDETPQMEVHLIQEEEGCVMQSPQISYVEGNDYLYFFDMDSRRILRSAKKDSLMPVLKYFSNYGKEEKFINNDDLPSFSKYVYPLLASSMKVDNQGFDPYAYMPQKPDFQIYLDLPQDNMITGELYARYGEKRYNLLKNNEADGLRDPDEENAMKDFFCPWFNAADPQNNRMVLMDDDEKTYEFLTNGIPSMQEKADVYVSDKLKRLSVNSMPKVNVGISVVHDLLQLDLVSDTLTPAQLSEVLSRYDHKKKFYRLKTGEFLNIDHAFDEFENLADTLSLTPAQVAKGTVRLPRFRAMSLEAMEDTSDLEFNESESYRNLIEQMKNTQEIQYPVPAGLQAEMRPYQEAGFRWLYALNENGFGGLLSDEMGLGKTLQAIAFLGAQKNRGRSLVVCPASLVYNWSHEIERFLPSLKHRMITGSAPQRKQLLEESGEDEVLITSYDLLKRDLEEYQNLHFTCEIIDEAQYIKNSATQAAQAVKNIDASFRIAMTGTPIENRLSELWSIFDYLMPGFFHSYRYFRDNFESPIVKDNNEVIEDRLKRMISPFVLRRLKKDVLKDLPDKLEEVYYAPLEGEQKELYTARVQSLKNTLGRQSDQEFKENKIQILAELTRLRQICCDPGLVYSNYKSNSTKKDVCIDLIRNAVDSGHKVLLFSQFTSMLDELTARLETEGIRYHLLTGSTPKDVRSRMVESFAEDAVPVFCISLKAGGTGLNLTAADIVIHYDPWWNTAVENQASDRAHRIGQKNVVTVYRLIMKDTIEERILSLQQEKSGLADRVLSGEGVSSSSLSREDLMGLL